MNLARLIARALLLAALARTGLAAQTADLSQVDAGNVIGIADGDFLASTYADQRLPEDDTLRDRLLVWSPGKATPPASLDVSNSVTSPPEVLVASADGCRAFVVERLGQRDAHMQRVPQLTRGGRLSMIALAGPGAPRVLQQHDLGANLEAVDLRPQGDWLATIATQDQRSTLYLIPVDAEAMGAPVAIDLARFGLQGAQAGVTALAWHPSGTGLALNVSARDLIVFLRFDDIQGRPSVEAWGAPVRVGRDPFTGRFTPDGDHYLSLDWGRDLHADTLEGRLPTHASRISVVRLDTGASARHRVTQQIDTDRSSEGIAVSADGHWVATVNMRETALPVTSPRHSAQASISLLAFDPQRSQLRKTHQLAFDGVLPEGATFDRSGKTLLVSVFQRTLSPTSGAAIALFRVDARRGTLSPLGQLPAPHGLHHLVVTP